MSWILIDLSWMIKTQESYELSLCRVLGFRGIFKGSAAQQARPAPLDRREMAKQIHDARQHLRFSPRFGRVDDSWWSGISWEMDSWLSLWTCCSFSGIRAAEWWTCDNCQCAFDSRKFDLIGEMVGPFESTDRPAHVNWLSWGVLRGWRWWKLKVTWGGIPCCLRSGSSLPTKSERRRRRWKRIRLSKV